MSIILPNPPSLPDTPGGGGLSPEVNRRLTRDFIAVRPVVVTLTPRAKEKRPAGGWAWVEQAPRQPQTMTLIEQTGLSGQPRPQVTLDGVDREVEFELLGEWDAAMAAGDVFTFQGKTWEIVGLYFENGYERRAMVSARG